MQNNNSPLDKVKEAIPENVVIMAKKVIAYKAFKIFAGIAVVMIAWALLKSPSTIPPEQVMYDFLNADESLDSTYGSVEITSFNVDFCEVVENERRQEVAECTITYETVVRTPASNHMRRIPASRLKIPASTEQFRFWQDDNEKWVMERLY
jgi:hypothetical protein